jgi:hypothetical protein
MLIAYGDLSVGVGGRYDNGGDEPSRRKDVAVLSG